MLRPKCKFPTRSRSLQSTPTEWSTSRENEWTLVLNHLFIVQALRRFIRYCREQCTDFECASTNTNTALFKHGIRAFHMPCPSVRPSHYITFHGFFPPTPAPSHHHRLHYVGTSSNAGSREPPATNNPQPATRNRARGRRRRRRRCRRRRRRRRRGRIPSTG